MSNSIIPARQARAEIVVINSRFIATVAPAFSAEEAQAFIRQMRVEYADASHNVPLYIIGHGASTITHCSDDGEPSGTAGRPALAVLSGSGLGDVVLVITRYFGGTKLGTGGLVRAYSDATRAVLEVLPRARKVPTHTAMLVIPYQWVERLRRLAAAHQGEIIEEDFAADVTVSLRFPVEHFAPFQQTLGEMSHGSLSAEIIDTSLSIIEEQAKD